MYEKLFSISLYAFNVLAEAKAGRDGGKEKQSASDIGVANVNSEQQK